jgi:Uma2 family endonuclease
MDRMGTTTTAELMTFEEFERLPEEPGELELLNGELIRLPPPKRMHVKIIKRLFRLLDRAVETLRKHHPEIGEAEIEMGYLLQTEPRSWLRPDLSITHRDQPGEDYYQDAPLIAIEIISESEAAKDVDAKAKEYLAHGSREVWLIYPITRRAWICRPGTVAIEEQSIRSELLPGVEIPLDQILG